MNRAQSKPQEVGIIGLGLMGSAMAARLMGAAIGVIGFDIDVGRRRQLQDAGGVAAESAGDVMRRCLVVFMSLPDGGVVEKVVAEFSETWGARILIDTTTGSPESAAASGEELKQRGATYVEATISGNSEELRRGEVSIMAGGPADAVERIRWLLNVLGREVHYVGEWGSASGMKLVTNLVLGLNRAALAEGLALANGLGFDLRKTLEILKCSAAYSRAMEVKGRKMVEREFTPPQAKLAQHLKDVGLMMELGKKSGVRLPMSEAHRRLLEKCVEAGMGDWDNSAIVRVFEMLRQAEM